MNDHIQNLDRVRAIVGWSVAAFIALLPLHVVSVDIGFSLKPWMLPLGVGIVGLVMMRANPLRAVPRLALLGVAIMLLVGFLAAFGSADPTRAFRHVLALIIAALALLLVSSVPRVPYLGVAIRIGAIAMAIVAIGTAMLVTSGALPIENLMKANGIVAPMADVVYGDIVVVNVLHVDSNFAAMYAVVWLFLLLAFPAERWFGRYSDSAIIGGLLVVLGITVSKTGAVAVVVAVFAFFATYVAFRVARREVSLPNISFSVILVIAVALSSALALADGADGSHEIAHGMEKRARQFTSEFDRFEGMLASIGLGGGSRGSDDSDEDFPVEPDAGYGADRSGQWRTYFEDFRSNPILGTGLGTPSKPVGYAHNAILEAAGGSGFAGPIGYVMFWVAGLIALVSLIRRRTDLIALVGAVGALFVGSMFLTTNYEPIVAVVLGLVFAQSSVMEGTRETEEIGTLEHSLEI